ncbi:MAG: DUF1800 family protein, partial [Verrucomicrobiota bacterium]
GFGIHPDSVSGTTEVFWSDNLVDLNSNTSLVLPTDYSNQTVLLVLRIDFGASTDEVDLWVNPILTDAATLGTTGDLEASTSYSSVTWVGAGMVNTGITGYTVEFDNLLLSNEPDEEAAFAHVTGIIPGPVYGSADVNANGLPDLAEIFHPGITEVSLSVDSDGDGHSNFDEATARTDPFDAQSFLESLSLATAATSGDEVDFTFSSVAGVSYQIEVSDSLESWTPVGPALLASGPQTMVTLSRASFPDSETAFLRAIVLPSIDSDGDGLEDALERYLGFDPYDSASVRSSASGGDLQQFVNLVQGANPDGGAFGPSPAGIPSEEQASRFLAQASFGPTIESINELRSLGPDAYEHWIDQQLASNPNFLRSYIDLLVARMNSDASVSGGGINPTFPHFVTQQTSFAMFRENVNTVWMRQALFAPDQLRQRVAWALSQIVVIGPRCNSYGIAAADWYDTVIEHSFGNYRDLLYDIATHPWMGWYLSHLGNRKADPTINRMPDENFAREIMQLFSIGLWQLNMDGTRQLDSSGEPIPTYSNEDIIQLARVFTGMELQTGVGGQAAYSVAPMRML